MNQNIFQASSVAKRRILASIDKNTVVQKTGFVAVYGDEILFFESRSQANRLAANSWIFSYIYRYNNVELTPAND